MTFCDVEVLSRVFKFLPFGTCQRCEFIVIVLCVFELASLCVVPTTHKSRSLVLFELLFDRQPGITSRMRQR